MKFSNVFDFGTSTIIMLANMAYKFTPQKTDYEVKISKSLSQKGVKFETSTRKLIIPKLKSVFIVIVDHPEMDLYEVRETSFNDFSLLKDWEKEVEGVVNRLEQVIKRYGDGCETEKFMQAIATNGSAIKNIVVSAGTIILKYFKGINFVKLVEELNSIVPTDETEEQE